MPLSDRDAYLAFFRAAEALKDTLPQLAGPAAAGARAPPSIAGGSA